MILIVEGDQEYRFKEHFSILLVFYVIIIVVCMSLTYIAVKKQEDSVSSSRHRNSIRRHSRQVSRQVFKKGILFVGAFCCVWVPPLFRSFIIEFNGRRNDDLTKAATLIVAIFLPLQGFLNMIIYNYPKINILASSSCLKRSESLSRRTHDALGNDVEDSSSV